MSVSHQQSSFVTDGRLVGLLMVEQVPRDLLDRDWSPGFDSQAQFFPLVELSAMGVLTDFHSHLVQDYIRDGKGCFHRTELSVRLGFIRLFCFCPSADKLQTFSEKLQLAEAPSAVAPIAGFYSFLVPAERASAIIIRGIVTVADVDVPIFTSCQPLYIAGIDKTLRPSAAVKVLVEELREANQFETFDLSCIVALDDATAVCLPRAFSISTITLVG
jgi:hypothetical protein